MREISITILHNDDGKALLNQPNQKYLVVTEMQR
jgi:hypothetical protein